MGVCNLSVNSDSIFLRDIAEVCDEHTALNLSVGTLNAAVHQIHLCHAAIIYRGGVYGLQNRITLHVHVQVKDR